MSPATLDYFIFLAFAGLLHGFCPAGGRPLLLVVASYAYYASWGFIHWPVLLLALTASTWWCGRRMRPGAPGRGRWFVAGVACNLLILGLFKYSAEIFYLLFPVVPFPAPLSAHLNLFGVIGLSFIVFQSLTYLVEVHLGQTEPEPGFLQVALLLAFFPKLTQGPIERAGEFLPQARGRVRPDYEDVRFGLWWIAIGMVKKELVANWCYTFNEGLHHHLAALAGFPLWLGLYATAFEIYFDFSGYTDIALGSARLFGIRLTDNFDRPYLAPSIAEFWRRWHVTLSRFILDHLFRPLQFAWRDRGRIGTIAALLAAFLACGIWHGLTGPFVAWGLLHGIYLSLDALTQATRRRFWRERWPFGEPAARAVAALATFHLVAFGWILFTADSLPAASRYFAKLFTFPSTGSFGAYSILTGLRTAMVAGTIVLLLAFEATGGVAAWGGRLFGRPAWFRWAVYWAIAFTLLIFGCFERPSFLYFNF